MAMTKRRVSVQLVQTVVVLCIATVYLYAFGIF